MFDSKGEPSKDERVKLLQNIFSRVGQDLTMEAYPDLRLSYGSTSLFAGAETSDVKLIKCYACPFTATEAADMRKHAARHEAARSAEPVLGEKLYKCSECKYSTNRADHIKRHSAIHAGIKPHKCPYCEYRAGRKEHLRRHLGTHSWERPRGGGSGRHSGGGGVASYLPQPPPALPPHPQDHCGPSNLPDPRVS